MRLPDFTTTLLCDLYTGCAAHAMQVVISTHSLV
jgi:hypothetical protein